MEIILLYIITTLLFIHGFHSVTREGKLLDFMAIRLNEVNELEQLSHLSDKNLLEQLDIFCKNIETKDLHPQANDQDLARVATKFAAICREIKHKDTVYQEIEKRLSKKLDSKKWKFLLSIAPAWSECKLCMSSFWGLIWGLVFVCILNFGISFNLLILVGPFYIAGLTSIIESLSNSIVLKNIAQSLEEIADGQ